jgi:hypothetical protein
MANTILTPTAVTRKALQILHQKLNFVGNINREYDDSFAKSGAKIGDSLKIRLPNQYTVRTGATLSTQDTTESSVTLQVATQKGVDLNFTSSELTLSLDDFADRILEPAMAVLAANIEADALSMYKDVYQQVGTIGSAATFKNILEGRKKMNDSLTPNDGKRTALLNTQQNVDLVDALKGLFQDSTNIAKQYRDGMMGRTGGYEFGENTMIPRHTVGTKAGTPLVNGGSQTGASLITDGWTASSAILKKGDIFHIAGVFSVHPETKVSTGSLQQFVVTADVSADGTGNATVAISPSIITSGATQNVSGSPADNAAITVAGTASTAHDIGLLFHKDAFCFATADLVMPQGIDFAAREVYDGISIRVVRQYDINNDKFPCRLDVLYGYKTLRGQLAARLATN